MIDQTEQLLRAAMQRFTADTDMPPGLAARAARHRQRSKRTRTAAVIGAAAVTAAVAAGVMAAPGSPRVPAAAYLTGRVQGALAQVTSQNAIQYVHETTTAGIYISGDISGQITGSWTYRGQTRTAAYTSAGQITGEIGMITGHRPAITEVDYERKTWWRETLDTSYPSIAPTPESSCGEATVLTGGGMGIRDLAGEIRAALSCGQYVAAGSRRVDGVQALELRPARTGYLTTVFWVDPATYLPVRDQVTIGSRATIRDDFRWLRPTPANLAALDVRIPPGFTRVPPQD